MATSNKPTKAQIDQVVELMEETGIDLYLNVLPEVFINWEDQDVLALLPAEIVQAALVYLRQEKKAQDAEDDPNAVDL
jgi:H2-forming N5,N10-methylenetetrahydromethanopterin dehydrogenase-like enzyme